VRVVKRRTEKLWLAKVETLFQKSHPFFSIKRRQFKLCVPHHFVGLLVTRFIFVCNDLQISVPVALLFRILPRRNMCIVTVKLLFLFHQHVFIQLFAKFGIAMGPYVTIIACFQVVIVIVVFF
jgi:hypothetical protein